MTRLRTYAIDSIVLTGLLAMSFGVSSLAQNPEHSRSESSDPFLRKWLAQDVVYIIKDEERAAFCRLTADEERYHFIEQFWLRRDPTPETIANELRDEHYRRIVYANERFPTTAPGWKTDRGRTYIVWGPPDQIEAHPRGDANSPPFEIWRYRAGQGSERVLEFVGTEYKLRKR